MHRRAERLNAFPVFVRVEGRVVVIVGSGDEALAKARLLSQSSARLRIVAAVPEPALAAFIADHGADRGLEHVTRAYAPAHLEGAVLAFAASGEATLDARISADARRLGIAVNAVDRPELCDFFTPALVNRAPVAVAIGTEGAGPVLAQMIRARIDRMLAPSLGPLAALSASFRDSAEKMLPKGAARRRFWSEFFGGGPARALAAGDPAAARAAARELLAADAPVAGHVALVGAGAGAEDLLTLRAQRLLMEAEIIVYDALVPEAVVEMGRRDAERLPLGVLARPGGQEEINALLVRLGRAGRRVVRLRAGDLSAHGRAGEEIAALREAGISCEVVPGVAAAPAAGIALPPSLRALPSRPGPPVAADAHFEPALRQAAPARPVAQGAQA